MKKIVGILAAAAVLATSVFAADVSASTKIKGNLFSYDNAKTFSLFSQANDSHDYANPNMTFSVSDDKAGATIRFTTDGTKGDSIADIYSELVCQTTQTIWFKPVDAFKVTVGNYDVALNKEQIKWTESTTGLGGNGFLFSVNVESFGLDFGMSQADNGSWFEKKDADDDATIKAFFVKAAYSADFGTIGGFVEFNRAKADRKTYGNVDRYFGIADGTREELFGANRVMWGAKDGAIGDVFFGAGYRNNFDGIDLFVNLTGYMDDKFEWIRPEVYVSGAVDAFSYSAFVAPFIALDSDVKKAYDNAYDAELSDDKAFECEVVAKVSYALDGFTVYGQFYDTNILRRKFTSTIELGASGSISAMGWKTWLEINTGKGAEKDKVDIAVPFELTFNF